MQQTTFKNFGQKYIEKESVEEYLLNKGKKHLGTRINCTSKVILSLSQCFLKVIATDASNYFFVWLRVYIFLIKVAIG